MEEEEGKVKINKFDGQDFWFWKMQVEAYLNLRGLDLPLFGQKPENMSVVDWELMDRCAVAIIRLSLTENVANNVVNEKTTVGVLKVLSNMYANPSASNKVFLIRELVNTKMRESTPVIAHINEFNSIISRLISAGIMFDDEKRALLLLFSLPESWSATVTIISVSSGSAKLTFEWVKDQLLLNEDMRRRSVESGNNRGGSKSREREQSKNRKDVTCWNCKESGHFRNRCPKLTANKSR
ncbi:putative RNA-directed DNA polymerase [Helianthus debilis subsp. tardiflorus]